MKTRGASPLSRAKASKDPGCGRCMRSDDEGNCVRPDRLWMTPPKPAKGGRTRGGGGSRRTKLIAVPEVRHALEEAYLAAKLTHCLLHRHRLRRLRSSSGPGSTRPHPPHQHLPPRRWYGFCPSLLALVAGAYRDGVTDGAWPSIGLVPDHSKHADELVAHVQPPGAQEKVQAWLDATPPLSPGRRPPPSSSYHQNLLQLLTPSSASTASMVRNLEYSLVVR
jgi:hypothetical protein